MDIHRVHQFKAGASSLVVPVTDHHVFTIRSRFERKAQSAGAAVLILMFLAMTDAGFFGQHPCHDDGKIGKKH